MPTRPSAARAAAAAALGVALMIVPMTKLDAAEISVEAGNDKDLTKELRSASLLVTAIETDKVTDQQELVADAKADYRRLVAALYDKGYFSADVSIKIDGKEATSVPVLGDNGKIGKVVIRIDPGPRFKFSTADVSPLPGKEKPVEGFAAGQTATTGIMRKAAQQAVTDWKSKGYGRAEIDKQQITVNHDTDTVAASFHVAPGPRLTFGQVALSQRSLKSKVAPKRIIGIAGVPKGEVYSPDEISKAETRLRRAGAFGSAVVTEDKAIGPNNTQDTTIDVVDAKPRRLGFGAEITSNEGATLSGYWLHRNLFGSAERLRIDGSISGIGGGTGGMDYSLTTTLTYPAFKNPDMDLVYGLDLSRDDEPDYLSTVAEASVGVDRYITDKLTGSLKLGLRFSHAEDDLGNRNFRHVTFTTGLTWDNRNDKIDPTRGVYAKVAATPFLGIAGSESGLRTTADLRGYRQLGSPRLSLAGRVQLGNIQGPDIIDTPADWLFYSGGGGSVRGQGYESLGTTVDGVDTGGRSYSALSAEVRGKINDTWGAVAFVDYGYVSASTNYAGGEWQGGAGLGMRYFTGIGPIRLDVAVPTTGSSNNFSVYVGIGQSF